MPCPDGLVPGAGLDQRLRRSICSTRSFFGRDAYGAAVYAAGTGVLIDTVGQSSFVLTAAHNIWDPVLRTGAKWVGLHFGRDGDSWNATRDMVDARYPAEFDDDGSAPVAWDFALIRVKALGADRFTPIALEESLDDAKARLVGYPNEGSCKGRFAPYHAIASLKAASADAFRYANQATYQGMSGGPLLTAGQPMVRVIGTHVRGGMGARAVRHSKPMIARTRQWISELI